MEQPDQEEAREEQCAWEEKCEAEGKEANVSPPVLIHFYYLPQWAKSFALLLFSRWWVQHAAGGSDQGWHQSHGCPCALYNPHVTLQNQTHPKTSVW